MPATPSANGTVVLAPDEVKIVRAFGGEMHFFLTGKMTQGRFVSGLILAPPGDGPPPHYHTQEDEYFLVQEGRLSFLTDGAWKEAGPGTTVFTPKGTVHTYKNIGDTMAKMLFASSPAGFEDFFAECEIEFAKPGGPNPQAIVEISARHGIFYVTDDMSTKR